MKLFVVFKLLKNPDSKGSKLFVNINDASSTIQDVVNLAVEKFRATKGNSALKINVEELLDKDDCILVGTDKVCPSRLFKLTEWPIF